MKERIEQSRGSRSLDITNKECVEKGNDGPHNAVLINEATLSVRISLFFPSF